MGWKDIVRPIRDRLRDNLPSHDSPDENEIKQRQEQQQKDVLKGFAYFYTFDELRQWTPEDVDALQRANTPLLQRPKPYMPEGDGKTKIILIHDYSGNYHEYEACQGAEVAKEMYSCEYLQFVDTFVYFSHKLVCIPPPTWTNTLHRNGVKSFGTFLLEPQTPGIENILRRERSTQDGEMYFVYPVARTLARMAAVYGFDGWLLNIEKTFPILHWDFDQLAGFLEQLQTELGGGNVIWYDSLTTENNVEYQNGLTSRNIHFSQAAGSMLTNYAWTKERLLDSANFASKHGIPKSTICFGIDVWAQNKQTKGPPRRTYPQEGGGGTGTGLAVTELAKHGLSAGVFAPAWAYEHFPRHAKEVERAMWLGSKLPKNLECDCGLESTHSRAEYLSSPITESARMYRSGSSFFFYTNFQRAFRGLTDSSTGSSRGYVAHVGAQSVLPIQADPDDTVRRYWPCVPPECEVLNVHHVELRDHPPSAALLIKTYERHDDSHPNGKLFRTSDATGTFTLFDLDMDDLRGMDLSITYSKKETPEDMKISFGTMTDRWRLDIPSKARVRETVTAALDNVGKNALGLRGYRLLGLQVHVEGNVHNTRSGDVTEVMEILEICIKKRDDKAPDCAMSNLRVESRTANGNAHTRLCWDLESSDTRSERSAIPYSPVTGPVAYFVVCVAGLPAARAYTLAYVLSEQAVELLRKQGQLMVVVTGYGFDGKMVCRGEMAVRDPALSLSEETWEMLEWPDGDVSP